MKSTISMRAIVLLKPTTQLRAMNGVKTKILMRANVGVKPSTIMRAKGNMKTTVALRNFINLQKRRREPMKKLIVFMAVLAMVMTGCATMNNVISAKGNGISEIYPIPEDKAWDLAIKVLRDLGAGPIEEHRKENLILTSSVNWSSAHTYVAVWVESVNQGNTKVIIVTRCRDGLGIFGMQEWEFHQNFKDRLTKK